LFFLVFFVDLHLEALPSHLEAVPSVETSVLQHVFVVSEEHFFSQSALDVSDEHFFSQSALDVSEEHFFSQSVLLLEHLVFDTIESFTLNPNWSEKEEIETAFELTENAKNKIPTIDNIPNNFFMITFFLIKQLK